MRPNANETTESLPPPDAALGECELLGPFSLIVQGSLGGLAILALVYKRWKERPQRPVKVWAFDVSKQVVGSVMLHILNLVMSLFSAGQGPPTSMMTSYKPNPCSFYILNLGIDTTVGIPVLALLLRLLHHVFSLTPLAKPPESILSGHYGHPPKATWWLKQSFVYFLGLLGMKFCVFVFFQLCPWIVKVGNWTLKWTEGNEFVQIFFVMLLFPLIMNAIQYYIIDGFIKGRPTEHEIIPVGDVDDDNLDDYLEAETLATDGEDESDALMKAASIRSTALRPQSSRSMPQSRLEDARRFREYDPQRDGDDSRTVVAPAASSSSSNSFAFVPADEDVDGVNGVRR